MSVEAQEDDPAEKPATKLPYSPPKLIVYGNLRHRTQGKLAYKFTEGFFQDFKS